MRYQELFQEENKAVEERYQLSMERIAAMLEENTVPAPFDDYFKKTAAFILEIRQTAADLEKGKMGGYTLDELKAHNRCLYQDITAENYEKSYANPAYAKTVLGADYSQLLSFLYTEIRGMTAYAFESRYQDLTICCEVFIEIYNLFEETALPASEQIRDILYWFVSDYCDITITHRVRELVDPELDFAVRIISDRDLNDLRYLYAYGEYISDTELSVAEFLNAQPEETISLMAKTYAEGYRKGFEVTGRDLARKKTVVIRYPIGFERMVKAALPMFAAMGLQPVIYRYAVNSINKTARGKSGYFGTSPNRQYDYDHRFDHALYLDKALKDRKIAVYKTAFEKYKKIARVQAGPAVIETFGEKSFQPVNKEEACALSSKQQKLEVAYANEAGQIVNEYIPGDERSFTIIAFPVPEIGPDFQQIFTETIRINTLDYELYRDIQQKLIDALDEADYVQIKGAGANVTDLKVKLHPLENLQTESNFENCVADVNIPVGEVFTSPQLAGTEGVLHVQQVYLNDLQFKDLKITFKDGMTDTYSCENFPEEEENKKLIKANILNNHDSIPMGEFAIGTNTTAYAVAGKYQIFDKMPILIAEKMGPHFAVGDTCYSWSEDCRVYNPDGKEIVAKDNEVSIRRKEDVAKAYFNCHTDITIMYHELDSITAVRKDGTEIRLISGGRFVLPGTEELNKPLT